MSINLLENYLEMQKQYNLFNKLNNNVNVSNDDVLVSEKYFLKKSRNIIDPIVPE